MSILLTGCTGFVGNALMHALLSKGFGQVCVAVRRDAVLPPKVRSVLVSTIDASTDWTESLFGVDVVIHAAARAHIMNGTSADPLSDFRRVNVDGTLNLARQAAVFGVRRFVFISSVKVNGEGKRLGQVYQADDVPEPDDPYGFSKAEAEAGLCKLANETGMELVIIRPVLVYGQGVKGNFASISRWIGRGVPLPLGAVNNLRSLLALDNLVDFVLLCADRNRSPAATNQIFLVSDGEDVSTTTLLRRVAKAQGRSARLLPVPVSWLRFAACLLGKKAFADRLLGDLQVDASKAQDLLGWRPIVTMEQQLAKMYSDNGNV